MRTATDALTGALAAVQALALSLAVVTLPALVASLVAGTSGAGGGEGNWHTPLEIGSGIWLLAHGVPVTTADATFSLVPLGLTVLAVFTCRVTARHAARVSWPVWGAATGTYALGTTALAVAVPSVTGWAVAAAFFLGALVGGLGFGLGMASRSDTSVLAVPGPPLLKLGARAGMVAVVSLAGLASLLVGAWAVAGRPMSSDIIRVLDPGWTGGIILAIAQLLLLPDLVLWAAAWLSGAGFVVGTGTSFTPVAAESGPLPAVPILAALPADDWTGAAGWAVPLVVVGCGALAGWYAVRESDSDSVPKVWHWSDAGFVLGGLVASSALVMGVLQLAASGAAGAERLSDVGAVPWLSALLIAGELLVGAAVVIVLTRLWSLVTLRAWLSSTWTVVRSWRADSDRAVS